MVTPKTEAKTDAENKTAAETKLSSFTAKNELIETFLKNSSTLSNAERAAFFEKVLGGKNEVNLKTSAGTEVHISHSGDLYSISVWSKDNVDMYRFTYDSNGKFQWMIRDHQNKDGSLRDEESKNLWAEKRGDSFIKDLQKTK